MNIKILGTGCPKCKVMERVTTEVVTENNYKAEISKVKILFKQ
ncbi:MAG: thioredoxin family protein [Candidatus Kapaibacteriales bacterium]